VLVFAVVVASRGFDIGQRRAHVSRMPSERVRQITLRASPRVASLVREGRIVEALPEALRGLDAHLEPSHPAISSGRLSLYLRLSVPERTDLGPLLERLLADVEVEEAYVSPIDRLPSSAQLLENQ
jgi:hypothetical protein